MKKIILYIILGISLVSNSYFCYKNNHLKEQVKHLEQENEKLKETPEIYWQNAIENFNNKNYTETKEILSKLIEKFPANSLVKNSQEKINEINLIEKKRKEEEQRIIKSLSKQIANTKNTLMTEKLLNDLDNKYDDSYSELKNVIKSEREKIREQIEIEKEKQKENKLGGGYKKLKWGMSKRQIEQTLSAKVRHIGAGIYSVYLKEEGTSVDCNFYNDKLYRIYIFMQNIKMSGENNIDIVYKKLLQKLSKKFNEDGKSYEKNSYGLKTECHFWEDKYTKITVECDKNGYEGIIRICYESKNIIKQIRNDEIREKKEEEHKYNENLNKQINNL